MTAAVVVACLAAIAAYAAIRAALAAISLVFWLIVGLALAAARVAVGIASRAAELAPRPAVTLGATVPSRDDVVAVNFAA